MVAFRCLTKSMIPPLYWYVIFCSRLVALVDEDDLEALVQERHGLQTFEHGAGDELDALGGEDRGIGPERDRGAGLAATRRCVADDEHLALRHAALGVLLTVVLAVAVDLDDQPFGQGVDDGDADAVEAAGHLVAVATELAAGVQHGEHDLGGALALVLARRERVDRDAPAVVVDLASAVGEQGDADAGAVARHRLVDGVVDDFPDQVMEPGQAGRADVHAWPFADRVEALEDLDGIGVVGRRRLRLIGIRSPRATRLGDVGFRNFGRVVGHSYLMSCWRSIAWSPPRSGDLVVVMWGCDPRTSKRRNRPSIDLVEPCREWDSSYQRGVSEPGSTARCGQEISIARRRRPTA